MSEDKFARIEVKLDKLDERLDAQGQTLAINTQSLQDHMKRTSMLETRTATMEEKIHQWSGGAKALASIGGILAAIAALLELVHFFGG